MATEEEKLSAFMKEHYRWLEEYQHWSKRRSTLCFCFIGALLLALILWNFDIISRTVMAAACIVFALFNVWLLATIHTAPKPRSV